MEFRKNDDRKENTRKEQKMGNNHLLGSREEQVAITTKDSGEKTCDGFTIGYSSMQGMRDEMEDEHLIIPVTLGATEVILCAIMDGHGGNQSSKFARARFKDILELCFKKLSEDEHAGSSDCEEELLASALKDAIVQIDSALYASGQRRSGSTLTSALITPSHYLIANLGDSRTLVKRIDGDEIIATVDHKPNITDEKTRIERAGGYVEIIGVPRINGSLAVSRGLGDFEYKNNTTLSIAEQIVSAVPDVTIVKRIPDRDSMLMLACDGLWDIASNEEVTRRVEELIAMGETSTLLIAEELCDWSLEMGSQDNISCICVVFPPAFNRIVSPKVPGGVLAIREERSQRPQQRDIDIYDNLTKKNADGTLVIPPVKLEPYIDIFYNSEDNESASTVEEILPGRARKLVVRKLVVVRHSERLDEVDSKGWYKTASESTCRRAKQYLFDDPPLTQNGHSIAALAVDVAFPEVSVFNHDIGSSSLSINKVYCSRLVRCIETAAAFAKRYDLPLFVSSGLAIHALAVQKSRGHFDFLTIDEIRELLAEHKLNIVDCDDSASPHYLPTARELFEQNLGMLVPIHAVLRREEASLIVAHRETIWQLVREKRKTPYCGTHVFDCEMSVDLTEIESLKEVKTLTVKSSFGESSSSVSGGSNS